METPRHMTPDEFQTVGRRMVDWIAEYMRSVEDAPVSSRVEPGAIAAALPEHPPSKHEEWDAIFGDLERFIMPGVTHWQSPNFFGYFPCNATGPSIIGELLSAGLGVQGMMWSTSPACTELETRMLDWLAEMIDLPEHLTSRSDRGGGVIQGTASEATLVAMIAARERALKNGRRSDSESQSPPRLSAYASSQAHSSVAKAATIAGIGREALRLIPTRSASDLSMDPAALCRAIENDLRDGLTPFFVCATVGTTSSTAIDPVRALGEVCRDHNLWLHVDAAYAGAACVCPEHRGMLDGVELASSFDFNPHKWLLTSFDCSAMWVADREALIEALTISPEYLRNRASESGRVIDYRDWQIPLGRRFRALKLWFVIRHYGVEGLQAHIREHIRLASLFEQWVAADDRFELAAPRTLSLVCFRLRGSDDRNRALLSAVNASGEAFLTHTTLPDPQREGESRFVLRLAIGAVNTQERHVRRAWDHLQTEAQRVLTGE